MEAKEERLVARLRHHNPNLTVTELHIGGVDRSKKDLVIDYLNSLRLNLTVETSSELETVVSVDLSSSTEQNGIFKKLLAFIRDIGIGDVSITSEPFDERQPEIESTDSIPAMESSSKDYTPLNSEDIEDLISCDKSESEFELILSRPRRSCSHESRRLHGDQSSRDVIGSILRVGEGSRSQSSRWSLVQRPILTRNRLSKNLQPDSNHRMQTFWSRAKSFFKKKRNPQKQCMEHFQAMVSKDSIQAEAGKSNDKRRPVGSSTIQAINTVNKPNQVSLNTLQKRLEKVSHDVFSIKNKFPAIKSEGPPQDAYTQTQDKTVEAALKNTKTQTVENKSSRTDSKIGECRVIQNSQLHSHAQSLSEMSVISDSTDSEDQVMMNGGVEVSPQSLRGMVTNLIPLYPKEPANLKRPVICGLKPVGAPFFFRRMTPWKTSSHSTATSCLTTATESAKSSRSTVTFSSLSFPSNSQEPVSENGSTTFENIIYSRLGDQYLSCGIVSTTSRSPFERERLKKTQTVDPPLRTSEINTSEVFKLTKVTQTKPRKKKKMVQIPPAVGTQTFACSSSTSCTELLTKKSCGTKTENEVERVDKENSCHLLAKKATETKETNSESLMLKCEGCQVLLDKLTGKKRKWPGRQKNDRTTKRVFGWGQYPDGNFGFGQSYAPGKVFPVISLATDFSVSNPFALPPKMDKGENQPCPKICNLFGSKKRALMEELKKQKMELMQMRMVLVAINEELLAECTDTSSDENAPSSDDTCHSSDSHKNNKKVTFRDPLVNERTVNYANQF